MTTKAHSSTSQVDPTHAEMHVDHSAAAEVPGEASQSPSTCEASTHK